MIASDWKPISKDKLGTHAGCTACHSHNVEFSTWALDDGSSTDYHYRCLDCDNQWWNQGPK